MRRLIIIILVLFLSLNIFAQNPPSVKYQPNTTNEDFMRSLAKLSMHIYKAISHVFAPLISELWNFFKIRL